MNVLLTFYTVPPICRYLLSIAIILYGIYLIYCYWPRKSKYKIDDITFAQIKILYRRLGIMIIEKKEERLLRIYFKDGKVIESWHPNYISLFSFMEIGDVFEVEEELYQKERR